MKKIDLKPICCNLCMLWGTCICSDQPPEFNLEDMNAQIRHWFGTVGWFVQLLGGTFRQESDYPTFYHLAVLDYKPCYSQEPWLVIVKNLG